MPIKDKKNDILQYLNHPLMRNGNIIYYGSMSDPYIIMMQILETKTVKDIEVATRVSVQLQYTSQSARRRIDKKTEKSGLWSAMDIAHIWLARALSAK